MTFDDLWPHWLLIEADLQDAGVDVGDEQLMRSRTWRWLRTRIVGLLTRPPVYDAHGAPRWATRIQTELTTDTTGSVETGTDRRGRR